MISEKKEKIIRKLLQPFIWEYFIDPLDVYILVRGKTIGESTSGSVFNQETMFIRLLERMPWFQLLEVFGITFLKKRITQRIIKKLRDPLLREHYESVRCILHGKTLPFSGWRTEYRQKIRATLLSDRRYCLK